MRYQDIREGNKVCGISISKNGITLIFPQYPEPQFIGVSVDDDELRNRWILVELLESSDGFRVVLDPGHGTRLDFIMEMPVEQDLFFPPLSRELTWDEAMSFDSGRGPCKELLEVFSEVDLNDENAVLAGISETIRRTMHGDVLPVSSLLGWPAIKKAAKDFWAKTHFGALALEDPDEYDASGGAIFDFESDEPRVFELGKKDLPEFIRLVKTADWLALEGFSSDSTAMFVLSLYS